jgi:hypothetical protein
MTATQTPLGLLAAAERSHRRSDWRLAARACGSALALAERPANDQRETVIDLRPGLAAAAIATALATGLAPRAPAPAPTPTPHEKPAPKPRAPRATGQTVRSKAFAGLTLIKPMRCKEAGHVFNGAGCKVCPQCAQANHARWRAHPETYPQAPDRSEQDAFFADVRRRVREEACMLAVLRAFKGKRFV